jgi:hypothetical protein
MLIRWDRNGRFLFARATEGATPLQGVLANWREIEDEQLVVMKVEAMRRGARRFCFCRQAMKSQQITTRIRCLGP